MQGIEISLFKKTQDILSIMIRYYVYLLCTIYAFLKKKKTVFDFIIGHK